MPNYLTHLCLAEDTPTGRVGNLLGDFIKLRQAAHLPMALQRGLILHQAMDGFTDRHPIVLRSKARISSLRRRYAGILIDIFYDHFLASHWQQYHPTPLLAFTHQIYDELAAFEPVLPDRLRSIRPIMSAENWLLNYQHLDGIESTLQRFAIHRLKQPSTLGTGVIELTEHYVGLGEDFQQFFPALQAFTQAWHQAQPINLP
ncbi:acyl carrier protein phosphodiesterase [Chitinivorax tropicus]|uniref:Acyl carrier protein phosphodiesterase n=1 Tax=Chitinivorax tropicus TaxID=714531 RepID=A0A840MT03_9PROT|nr:ACP phosphodiesterase [Chitinivorax tropicus]MBB5020327.1 acyl carrier protein phosphodiesterase [Chitinivorax tropicus]